MFKESPFSKSKAGRQFQLLIADKLAWIEYCALGPDKPSKFQSDLVMKKSLWTWGKKNISKFFPNIFDRDTPKPKPKIDMSSSDHSNYDNWLFDFLNTDWNKTYKETQEAGSFLGYLSGYLSGNLKLPIEVVNKMSMEDYGNAIEYKTGLKIAELEPKLDKTKEQMYAKIFAEGHGAEFMAVYDENGNRSGAPYDTLSKMYREMIVQAIDSGKSLEELQSDMAYPDLMKLVESGKISEEEYLDVLQNGLGNKVDERKAARLNRNFARFAWTEANFAFSNGRLLALHDAGRSYVTFTRGVRQAL